MISFIVIGRNEGWKLTKCFESIFRTINYNGLKDYEVIYVDSNSTDDSIERAKKFIEIKIFKLTGDVNAAIGRNVGVKESKGEVLFFIDGDMEIQPEFLRLVYNEKDGLLYDFVSGRFIDYGYDHSGKLISEATYGESINNGDNLEFTVGGLFLIKRILWNKVGGMKNKLRRSQDIDFAIRLAKHNVFLLRKKEILAIHHTIPYADFKRTWKLLLDGSEFYRSVLFRDNLFNKYQWKLFLRENYTGVLLLLLFCLAILVKNTILLTPYVVAVVARTLFKRVSILNKVNMVIYYFLRDIFIWIALAIFFPSKKKQFIYIECN